MNSKKNRQLFNKDMITYFDDNFTQIYVLLFFFLIFSLETKLFSFKLYGIKFENTNLKSALSQNWMNIFTII
jgi:hypothetical protein